MEAVKISVVLNTFNELYPMPGRDKDIFTLLIDSLKEQTLQEIELVMIDRLFEERKGSFEKLRLPFPFKYCPPKSSPWWDVKKDAQTISSDRNSGVMLSRGELILCLDDCCVPSHAHFLEQLWEHWTKKVLLRPTTYNYDYRGETVKILPDPLMDWLKTQEEGDYHLVSGKAMGSYLLPAKVWEEVNGMDERFDGAYGSEDSDLWERVDHLGVRRYVLGQGQYHLALIYHDHGLRDFRGNVHLVCNYAYAHWTYNRIHNKDEVRANVKILAQEDLEEIKLTCRRCPVISMCKDKKPWGLESYLERQPVFDLAKERKRLVEKFGEETGVVEPWEKENG